jgi:hypothetical protein
MKSDPKPQPQVPVVEPSTVLAELVEDWANGRLLITICDSQGVPADTVPVQNLVRVCGVDGFAIHRSIDDDAWTVTHIGTSAAAGTGPTPEEAVRAAEAALLRQSEVRGLAPKVVLKEALERAHREMPAMDAQDPEPVVCAEEIAVKILSVLNQALLHCPDVLSDLEELIELILSSRRGNGRVQWT